MSRRNVEASLDAVALALDHFASSLERSGFTAGAETYGKMAEIMIGQWLWAEQNDPKELNAKFARIARLAGRVDDQLRPYVDAMRRIRALEGMMADKTDTRPVAPAAAILSALQQSNRPLSASDLHTSTGLAISVVRRELTALLARNAISPVKGRARRFVASGARQRA